MIEVCEQTRTCKMCGFLFVERDYQMRTIDYETQKEAARLLIPLCEDCARKMPYALIKALYDPFDYVLKLRTGEIIRFHTAEIHGEWVILFSEGGSATNERNNFSRYLPFSCPRGVEVRISDIVWCADAPDGS